MSSLPPLTGLMDGVLLLMGRWSKVPLLRIKQ